jgi:outer membrane receptor protein involved in Fe transport
LVSAGACIAWFAGSGGSIALNNIYFAPGYVTFDGKIAYETDQLSLGVTGKNLADRRHFVPYSSGPGYIMPAEGRAVFAFGKLKY